MSAVIINGISIPVPTAPADPNNCPIAELGEYLQRQAIFEQRCRAAADGEDLSQPAGVINSLELERRYEIPMEQLLHEAQAEAAVANARALDDRRAQAATTFVSLTPQYKMCPENSQIMRDELNRRGLVGTVSDFQALFADLSARGKLKLNPTTLKPARVYSESELRAMPLEQCEAAIREMQRNDVF
jgi:hypothetical protein